jgi:polar amino acid transport system substrate-binding protein
MKAPTGLVAPGQLTVCISNGTFEPMYSSEGGSLTGFAPDMYRALAKLWDLEPKFDPMAFAGQIPSLQAKRCDFLAELSITKERLETLDGIAWMKGGMSLLVPEGNPKNIQTRADLAGLTVAVLQSSTAAEILADLNKTEYKPNGLKEVNIQIYPGAPESYAAVVNGKADAVLDQSLAKNLISQRMDKKIVPLSDDLFDGLGAQPFGLYMNQDNPILEPTTEALKALYGSGELKAIAEKNNIDPALLMTPVANPDDVD